MSNYNRRGSSNHHHHHYRQSNDDDRHHRPSPKSPYKQTGVHENRTRRLMVHQTDPHSAELILTSQRFNPSHNWDSVGSIYFAETAPETDNKAQRHGTYLMADVYLGVYRGRETDFGAVDSKVTAILNEKGKYNEGREYIIKDPDRARNIRYLDGSKPPGIQIEFRDRMALIFATTAQKAAQIINDQKLPTENRQDIAGYGYYLWENIPDARRFSTDGTETFLAADVHFPFCFENRSGMPDQNDIAKYKSFRGVYQDTHYYMVKNPHYIEHIHYISGTRP